MKKIFNTIIEALQEAEIKHFVAEEEKSCVDFCIDGEKATYHVHLYAEEDQELLICATVFPIKVPQDRISEMCVLINRINDSNLVTSLVIDPEDGLLQCRFPATVDDGAINKKIVAAVMCNTINCFETNYEDILKGIAG